MADIEGGTSAPATGRKRLFAELRDRIAASDPAYSRLRLAARAMLSLGLSGGLLAALTLVRPLPIAAYRPRRGDLLRRLDGGARPRRPRAGADASFRRRCRSSSRSSSPACSRRGRSSPTWRSWRCLRRRLHSQVRPALVRGRHDRLHGVFHGRLPAAASVRHRLAGARRGAGTIATHLSTAVLLRDDPERNFRRAVTTIDRRINLILRDLMQAAGDTAAPRASSDPLRAPSRPPPRRRAHGGRVHSAGRGRHAGGGRPGVGARGGAVRPAARRRATGAGAPRRAAAAAVPAAC